MAAISKMAFGEMLGTSLHGLVDIKVYDHFATILFDIAYYLKGDFIFY